MEADSMTMAIVAAFLVSLPVLYRLLFASAGDKKTSRKALPPGSFGLPVVGHTLSLLRALRANTAEDWLRRRAAAYGPVSRLSLFRYRTAFLVGPPQQVRLHQPRADHHEQRGLQPHGRPADGPRRGGRRARPRQGHDGAVPQAGRRQEARRRHGRRGPAPPRRALARPGQRGGDAIDEDAHLRRHVMSTVLFGLVGKDAAAIRRELSAELQQLVQGIWAVPLNLPFTRFSRCLAASRRGRRAVAGVIDERRAKLERGQSSPADDIITHMLSKGLPDEEITDNVMFLMVAAHDTTAALITFLLRHLDGNKDAYAKVLQEQEEIARRKAPGEALSWDDLCRMRYTWAAAMETLRMVPPAFSMLRKALQDVEYGGYVIPKGWQVMYATNMTHWSPAIFPDPGRFDPARFQDPSAIPPYGFVPFGGGARICPGNEFAKVETLVAVHHIVTRFRWKLAAGCDGSFSRSPMPYPSQGLLIDIEPIHQGNTSR